MKKIFSTLAVAAALFAGYSAYNTQEDIELTGLSLANVEALANGSDDEAKSGRYRTVGCGSMAFRDWDQYCCENKYYNNCPKSFTNPKCSKVFGCE